MISMREEAKRIMDTCGVYEKLDAMNDKYFDYTASISRYENNLTLGAKEDIEKNLDNFLCDLRIFQLYYSTADDEAAKIIDKNLEKPLESVADAIKYNVPEIINHYGVNHQLRKLQEEVFEFSEAIMQHIFVKRDIEIAKTVDNKKSYYDAEETKSHITEEMADVLVLLAQFKEYYGISAEEVAKIMEQKINRQLQRVATEQREATEQNDIIDTD